MTIRIVTERETELEAELVAEKLFSKQAMASVEEIAKLRDALIAENTALKERNALFFLDRLGDSTLANLATERAAILQAITDPENQPSQFGTVTLAMYEALEAELAQCQNELLAATIRIENDGMELERIKASPVSLQAANDVCTIDCLNDRVMRLMAELATLKGQEPIGWKHPDFDHVIFGAECPKFPLEGWEHVYGAAGAQK